MQKYNNYLNLPNNTIKKYPKLFRSYILRISKEEKQILNTLPFGAPLRTASITSGIKYR